MYCTRMERGRTNRIKSNASPSCSLIYNNPNYDISMCRIETTILSPNGDVLVCRDRDSKFMNVNKSNKNSNNRSAQQTSIIRRQFCVEELCNPCDGASHYSHDFHQSGLLGGSPDHIRPRIPDSNGTHPEPSKDESIDSLLSMPPSFDYSQYEATSLPPCEKSGFLTKVPENEEIRPLSPTSAGFSMLFGSLLMGSEPEEASTSDVGHQEVTPDSLVPPHVMHGVPTCLPGLSEIQISKISAHPSGSHVLLISSEALLFSYGLNEMGQLGLGIDEKFIKTPTLVTAVLEAGGKTLSCAAGVDNSLIVVKTDGQRVRSLRDKERENENERIGMQKVMSSLNKDGYIKLTRIVSSPSHFDTGKLKSSQQQVVSPNGGTVMLHHQVYGFGGNRHKKLGLLNPPPDENTHLSLPHRVALSAKVWPDEIRSKSLPPAGVFQVATSQNHSAALVRRGAGDIELYTWGETRRNALALTEAGNVIPIPKKVESLSYNPSLESCEDDSITFLKESEYPANVVLGHDCTFVITNTGRCITVGTDKDGILGIGKASTADPVELVFSNDDNISSISVGVQHAFATSSSGNVYMWGREPVSNRYITHPEQLPLAPIEKAYAGYDTTAYIYKSGLVQTCGFKSGRLGQGEVPPNPVAPVPLFGGLRLWHEGDRHDVS